MDRLLEPQEAATGREGTGRLRPGLPSSQSPGRSYKEAFPGLNPLLLWGWRGSDSFLPHAHPCAQGPRLAQRGNSKPSSIVTGQPFPSTFFVLNHGGDTELRDTWSLFSRSTSRQNTAAETL